MELRQLETFKAVAEELSFSRAAARLGYVQSSVSAQVALLEQELRLPLFDRMGRKIALTEAGVLLLGYSLKLLDLAEETKVNVTGRGTGSEEVAGSLTVSCPETLLTYRLPSVLALFHERYPAVKLSIRPSAVGRMTGSARTALAEGQVDLAFVMDEPAAAQGQPAYLSFEDLMSENITVIAPPSHPLATSTKVGPRDLIAETVLLPEAPEAGCAYRGQFERQLAGSGVVPTEKMEFQSIEAVKRCVSAGMGISVLPIVAVEEECGSGLLAALDWTLEFKVMTRMVWHAQRWETPALSAFLATTREIFGH